VGWSDFAPRTVRFDHERFEWELFDDREVFGSFEGTTVDSDVEAEVDQFKGFFECASEGVDDSSYRRRMGTEDRDEVVVAVSRMEEEREIVFRCESQLWGEGSILE